MFSFVVGTPLSNGNGACLFTNVLPGTGYTVTFSNYPGSLVTQTIGTATGSDANSATGITPSITVLAGLPTVNIDAGVTFYTPLPLVLVSFAAKANNCEVIINWQTGVETEVKNYEVLRSTNGTDFKTIAIISSKGSNNTYTDTKAIQGERMYRLKVANTGATNNYSSVIRE